MNSLQKIAKIAVENTSFSFDKLFSYLIPATLENVAVGRRVVIPFGRGNKKRQGMIFAIEGAENVEKLKPITSVIDEESILSDELIKVVKYLVSNTFCTFYDAIKTVLPNGINYSITPKYTLAKRLNDIDFNDLDKNERGLIAYLKLEKDPKEISAILADNSDAVKKRTIEKLVQKGIVEENSQLKRKILDKNIRMVRIKDEVGNKKVTAKQKEVVNLLTQIGAADIKELCYLCGVTEIVIKNLEKNGFVELFEREVYRSPHSETAAKNLDDIVLNTEQQKAFTGLCELCEKNAPKVALLHGITGSGKTQIFLKLIKETIAKGKQALMMVPEIALTPQMVLIFKSYFGEEVAVLHSSLSLGEQLDEWKRIKRGQAKIAVGTRSAIFAPFSDLGLIIMDEEGEYSYKSESNPRYHAREVAKVRCVQNNCLLLLASATPSIESYYKAKTGKYSLFNIKNRYSNAELPGVYTIDLKQERLTDNSVISSELILAVEENLKSNEQSIILLNRRGYNTTSTCADCGETMMCDNCSVAMTYHKANGYMMCHYCGKSKKPDSVCPDCGGNRIKLSGLGTQRLEDELKKVFPTARILRMDTDTNYSRHLFEKNFNDFEAGEYDIMLGTQMIAKGLDFPNVTLVGVVSADQTLHSGDFKSGERTFALLTQVVGRSGRGDKKGKAYIQTYMPDNPIINFATKQDYEGFYEDEIEVRETLRNPPFCDLCVMGIAGESEKDTERAAFMLADMIKSVVDKKEFSGSMRILGPAPAGIHKLNGKYRFRLILKCDDNSETRRFIRFILSNLDGNDCFKKITVYADINGDTN